MNLVDEIKALISKTETPAPTTPPTTPPATPQQATPNATTPPADPNTPPATPGAATPNVTPPKEGDTFTRSEVEAMLKKQTEETAEAMKEIVKSFRGDGTPPVGGPAQPTDTAGDFGAWNKEIKAINEKNKN